MQIRVTTSDGTQEDVFVPGPNQRDATLMAMRIVTGYEVPPEGTTAEIVDLYAHE